LRVVVALDGRGEDSGDIQRLEFGVGGLVSRPYGGEEGVVFDGGVDRCGGEQGMEAAATRGFVVFLQEGLADGAFSAEASSSLVFLRLESKPVSSTSTTMVMSILGWREHPAPMVVEG
jgi:hypothetical protein